MSESVDQPVVVATPSDDIAALIRTVRSLLSASSEKILPNFADEVGRKVNLLAVAFPKEKDQVLALESFALIGVAIGKGSKDAGKRKPNPVRWAAEAPPSIQNLANDDERRAAIKLLMPLKAPWAVWYAMREAADEKNSKELTVDLVKWAGAASASQAAFIGGMADVVRARQTTSLDRISLVFKLGLKLVAQGEAEAGTRFPERFEDFARCISDFCRNLDAAPKTSASMQATALGVLEAVSGREPAVLLAPMTLRGLVVLSEVLGGWPKALQKQVATLSKRVLSMSILQIRLHGLEGSLEVKRILAFARQALPIDKVKARFLSESESIEALLAPVDEAPAGVRPSISANSGVQEQVAALLVAWDALSVTLAQPVDTREVESLLAMVAKKIDVDRLGMKGEVVPFQPFQHYLVDATTAPPATVRIYVPGVRAVRPDGSFRVLTRALVNPVG